MRVCVCRRCVSARAHPDSAPVVAAQYATPARVRQAGFGDYVELNRLDSRWSLIPVNLFQDGSGRECLQIPTRGLCAAGVLVALGEGVAAAQTTDLEPRPQAQIGMGEIRL